MLVESGALNEAEGRERGHKHDGPVFHTRGLTLSEEHRSIRTVASSRTERGGMLSVIPKLTRVTSSHCEVMSLRLRLFQKHIYVRVGGDGYCINPVLFFLGRELWEYVLVVRYGF